MFDIWKLLYDHLFKPLRGYLLEDYFVFYILRNEMFTNKLSNSWVCTKIMDILIVIAVDQLLRTKGRLVVGQCCTCELQLCTTSKVESVRKSLQSNSQNKNLEVFKTEQKNSSFLKFKSLFYCNEWIITINILIKYTIILLCNC